jgi:hypothetical protein
MNKIETIIQQDTRVSHEAIFYKGEVFTFFDSGLTRNVFTNDDKTLVIKVLIERQYKDYNLEEAEIYENASEEVRKEMAETKLVMDGFLIEQEFCNPIKFDDRNQTIPEMLFADSCRGEVGWTKEGKLVCFDLDEYKKY